MLKEASVIGVPELLPRVLSPTSVIGHPVKPFKTPVKVKTNLLVDPGAKHPIYASEVKMFEKARSHESALHSTTSVSCWLHLNVLGVGTALSVAYM